LADIKFWKQDLQVRNTWLANIFENYFVKLHKMRKLSFFVIKNG